LLSAKTFWAVINISIFLFAPAQRENPLFGVHLWQMETKPTLQSQMTVEDVLQNWPDTYSVFIHMKTKCIGCFLQRFCTLRDVAETYQIPLQELTEEVEKHVPTFNHSQRSTL
jgi:hybrid cluster-associated redox disulfide protein